MGIFSWILLGLIAGAIAKKIMPGEHPGGCLVTIALGVAGAMLGGVVASLALDTEMDRFFSPTTWVLSILGSIVVLAGCQFLVDKYGSNSKGPGSEVEERRRL